MYHGKKRKLPNKKNIYISVKEKRNSGRFTHTHKKVSLKKVLSIGSVIIGLIISFYFFWHNNQPCISMNFVHDVNYNNSYIATFELVNENKYMITGIEIKGEIVYIEPYKKENLKILGKCFSPDYIFQIQGMQNSPIMFFIDNPPPPFILESIEHIMIKIELKYIPKPFYYFETEKQSFTFAASRYNGNIFWTTY